MKNSRLARIRATAIRRIERSTGVTLVRVAPGVYEGDTFGEHEEGFSGVAVTVDARSVPFRAEVSWYGRDCDGYQETNRAMHYHPRRDSGFRVPGQIDTSWGWARVTYKSARLRGSWDEIKVWCRDVFAERMGY